jgi:hypothetical protein
LQNLISAYGSSSFQEHLAVGTPELVAEIRTAASTLSTAADAAQSGDLAATAIAIEDVLFRVESILSRIRLIEPPADHGGTPTVTNGRSSDA